METIEAKKPVESLSFELTQSKSRIIAKLEDRIKNYKFNVFATELSPNYIHYPSFRIEKDRIVVKRYRSAPIYIYLQEIAGGRTKLLVEQANLASRRNAVLIVFSVIMFAVVFSINLTGDTSIGLAILLTLIPIVVWGLVLFVIFYLIGKMQKYTFKQFANKIARLLEAD